MKTPTIPDKWVILKITHNDNAIYKVFATWYGGYLDGDRWQLNSGIVKIEDDEKSFKFYGHSGSCYLCHKDAYGTNNYTQSILISMTEKANNNNAIIEVLEPNSDFLNILN
jgi:hypothetical protein